MASVSMPVKKDPLDQVAKGLQIAQSMFGIYSDYRGIKNMNAAEDAAAAAKEDQANKVIDEKEKAALITKGGLELTDNPEDAQLAFTQKTKDGGLAPVYFKLPKEQTKVAAPRYQTVTTNEGVFAVNTANPADKVLLGSRPKPEKSGGPSGLSLPKRGMPKEGMPGEEVTSVPGFVLDGGVKPSQIEMKDARNALATYSTITSNLDELKSYVEKNGSFQFFGPEGAKMKQIATMTRLQMKEMANLGVLSATDYKFLDNMLQDPGSAGALFTRDDTAIAQIEELKKQTELKFLNGMMAKGFKLADQPAQNPANVAPSAPSSPSASPYGTATAAPAAPAPISREEALRELARRGIQPK